MNSLTNSINACVDLCSKDITIGEANITSPGSYFHGINLPEGKQVTIFSNYEGNSGIITNNRLMPSLELLYSHERKKTFWESIKDFFVTPSTDKYSIYREEPTTDPLYNNMLPYLQRLDTYIENLKKSGKSHCYILHGIYNEEGFKVYEIRRIFSNSNTVHIVESTRVIDILNKMDLSDLAIETLFCRKFNRTSEMNRRVSELYKREHVKYVFLPEHNFILKNNNN